MGTENGRSDSIVAAGNALSVMAGHRESTGESL